MDGDLALDTELSRFLTRFWGAMSGAYDRGAVTLDDLGRIDIAQPVSVRGGELWGMGARSRQVSTEGENVNVIVIGWLVATTNGRGVVWVPAR